MSALAPYVFPGGTAVVTGAASGMGEQLAHQLAARGSHLVLIDRDAERLSGVAAAVGAASPGVSVDTLVADLADTPAIADLAAEVLRRQARPTLLVNNAGVAMAGLFQQMTLEEFDWVQRINFHAPVALTSHLLPALLASRGSHIVNLSSLYGLISPAGQSAYSASKFALRGWSQSLRAELVRSGVGVTTVHPGGIRTRIASSARVASGAPQDQVERGQRSFERLLTYPADRAATDILQAVAQRRARLLIATSAKVPDVLARLFPVHHSDVLDWITVRALRH